MSGGAASLFKPSAEGFVGLWAPPVASKLQFNLQDIVQIFNSIVKQRQAGIARNGVFASNDISKFQKQIQGFLACWQYRYDKIKELHRIQPVEENADAIKPQFLAKWDDKKSSNAQDEFIREQYVLSCQLPNVCDGVSFAEHYKQLYERAKAFPGFPKAKFNNAEEVATLHNILLAEYKYLAGCDVEWLGKPAPFLGEGRPGDDDDAPAARAQVGAQGSNPVPSGAEPPSAAPSSEDQGANALGRAQDLAGQLADIASWGTTSDSFPLSQVNLLVFDHTIGRGALRYYHAAAILLFYQNQRTEAQERAFASLSQAWGEWFGKHITDDQLQTPPTSGPAAYSKMEVKKCAMMREELVKTLTDEVKATLELPLPREKLRKRPRGEPVDSQPALLRYCM